MSNEGRNGIPSVKIQIEFFSQFSYGCWKKTKILNKNTEQTTVFVMNLFKCCIFFPRSLRQANIWKQCVAFHMQSSKQSISVIQNEVLIASCKPDQVKTLHICDDYERYKQIEQFNYSLNKF